MKQEENPEVTNLRTLLAAIQTESALLKKVILTEEEEAEASKIFNKFDEAIQAQVFSTLNHLSNYQAYGWRTLADEADDNDGGPGPA